MTTNNNPHALTEAARKALEQYNTACRDLASAAATLKEAQERYAEAFDRYNVAYGAAKAMQVAS
jgi:hypothetical protein